MSGDIPGMDHRRIDEDDVVERYVIGTLGEDERTRFEEHLVGCAECAERAHWAEELRQGLRRVAVEDGVARRARPRPWLAAAAGFAAAASVALVLRGSPVDPVGWRDRYEAERERTERAEAESRELQRTVSRQNEELARSQPPVNPPAFLLSAVRAGEGAAAANRVRTGDAGWVVLSVEVDPDAGFEEYRGRIVAGGEVLWEAGGLKAGPSAILSLLLSTRLLRTGDHALVLEGTPAGGRAVPAGRYPFRVEPRS